MNLFADAIRSIPEMSLLLDAMEHGKKIYALSGAPDAVKPQLIYALGQGNDWKLVLCRDEKTARDMEAEYASFGDSVFFPAKDVLFYQADIRSNALVAGRLSALRSLWEKESLVIFTTMEALLNVVPDPESFMEAVLSLQVGDEVNMSDLRTSLVGLGYEAVTEVEGPGEFCVRGGILDVFPLTEELPYRLEFWGDEIDSIRSFDVESQISIEKVEDLKIFPASEMVYSPEEFEAGFSAIVKESEKLEKEYRDAFKTEEAFRLKSRREELLNMKESETLGQQLEGYATYFSKERHSLLDYLPKDLMVFYDEPARLQENGKALYKEFSESMKNRLEQGYVLPGQKNLLLNPKDIWKSLESRFGLMLSLMELRKGPLPIEAHFYLNISPMVGFHNSFELLLSEMETYKKRKMRMVLISPSRTRARRLAGELLDRGFVSYYSEDWDRELHSGEVLCTVGVLRQGYEIPDSRYVFIAESDIFGTPKKKKKRPKRYETNHIASLGDLTAGDYVVHENHGLGIYQGMEKIEVDHIMKDYIKISYAKGSNLYILATQFDQIGKYTAVGDKKPKLSTLGGTEWTKTKERVRGAVGEVAKELVELYALRQNTSGYVYEPDGDLQREFEETFPYEETEGQLEAIAAVKGDMESTKIMDRLICGDVGYGKTEIAIRAAFKAVCAGKQVVYLVPTTILAQQHYNTFRQRMAAYPITVELMSRFRTPTQNKQTVKGLKAGTVDIVIATHRVLSKDVSYKDLGLLIIDEEQRFGVTHKEKIKQLKTNVDVLSLSATPIPRTLHMSLMGIRDLSVLDEAPMERTPIQTFVFEQNPEMVREAINRELARGGQVYYVMNRIREIADVCAEVQKLVPSAHVSYAHGRMKEEELERIMCDFVEGDIDVLVATTIIEIGLDISNVNTIIIHDADQLGLSSLYQLRGRVGRSNRTAYAFLMYRRNKMLKEVAEKRLAAIREFTDLGSGFKIAMRDLEIRGAGNLLGHAQSGHMEEVGYDLYCKMLKEAVAKEKGEEVKEDFETVVDLKIDAYLPGDYVTDEKNRLSMYRRIAEVETEKDEGDVIEELTDRFGDPPTPVMNLLLISRIRQQAHNVYITEIKQKEGEIRFAFLPTGKIDPGAFLAYVAEKGEEFSFHPEKEAPELLYHYGKNNRVKPQEIPGKVMELLLEMKERLLLP